MKFMFVEKFSFLDKLLYGFLSCIFYSISYFLLIPFYIVSGKFNNNEPQQDHIIVSKSDTEIVFQSIETKEKHIDKLDGFNNIYQILEYSAQKNPDKKHLGTRKVLDTKSYKDPITNKMMKQHHLSEFHWKTYQETLLSTESLAYGLRSIHLEKDNKMCMFADTSEEWFLTFFACLKTATQIVSVFSTIYDESLFHVFNLTQVTHLFVDEKSISRCLKIIQNIPSVKYFVVSKGIDKLEYQSKFQEIGSNIQLYTLDELIKVGNIQKQDPETIPFYSATLKDTALIMFTSGSTGIPKGVYVKHENILAMVASFIVSTSLWETVVFPAFLPLCHIFELLAEIIVTFYGRPIGYCNPLTLTDKSPMIISGTTGDLTELKPTAAVFVPTILDRVSKALTTDIRSRTKIQQVVFQFFCDYKLHFLKLGHTTPIIDIFVFKKIRNILGGRIDHGICGGGFLTPELYAVASVVLGINLSQGYGSTETCGSATLKKINTKFFYSIGSPLYCVDLKLLDWKEGGYTVKDKPNPRGELAVCGKSVLSGYINLPEETEQAFKKDHETGKVWFHTGDICEMLPNGHLKIIDRKKDIVKLSHGEYVSLINIESRISLSTFVEQVCVLPNKNCEKLVTFIVPNRAFSRKYLLSIGRNVEDIENHLQDKDLKSKILEDVKSKLESLNKFETPSQYEIVKEVWTSDNNLTSPSLKLKRPEIKNFYQEYLK